MPTEKNQAVKGGELGLNGEFYQGGQFMPTSENTIKGLIRIPKGSGRKLIAPYLYDYAPADDMLSIYDRIGSACRDNRSELQYIKGQGFPGIQLEVIENTVGSFGKSVWVKPTKENGWDDTFTPFIPDPARYQWMKGLADRFNAGERWYPLAEDPYHYLNNKAE